MAQKDFVNTQHMEIPYRVKKILSILKGAGYEAYIVGGCIRDALLDRMPGDWDITTSALPHEVKSLFFHTVDTGIQHGTVMVLMGGEGFEVTTYRKDGVYSDARRPDTVEFTPSLEEDLKRRDFTINALAYSEETGVVDLFDGIRDLENGIIRCVGNADQRFSEDALRIMRAVRFAAQLSFTIEEATYEAIKDHAENLGRISMERIRVEFEKTLMSANPGYVNLYAELGLAPYIIKEGFEKCFREDSVPLYAQFQADSSVGEKEAFLRTRYLRLAAFFKELAANDAAKEVRALTYDNLTRSRVQGILANKDRAIPADKRYVKRALRDMGPELLSLVWEYKTAVMKADTAIRTGVSRCFEMRDEEALNDAVEVTEEIIKNKEPYQISMLAVDGNDIIAEGISPGAKVGLILNRLLEKVIDDPALNKKELLLAEIRRLES